MKEAAEAPVVRAPHFDRPWPQWRWIEGWVKGAVPSRRGMECGTRRRRWPVGMSVGPWRVADTENENRFFYRGQTAEPVLTGSGGDEDGSATGNGRRGRGRRTGQLRPPGY